MIRYLLLLVPFLLNSQLDAQSYDVGLGLRVGTDIGVTAQLRLPQIHKNFVLEGIIQSSLLKNQGNLTLLGKQHQNILSRRVNLFYGAGVHTGWTDELNKDGELAKRPFGIDGIIGAEITFARVNVSYDFKPAINVRGGDRILDTQTAVSVRYVLAKRNDVWPKKKQRANQRERNRNRRDKDKAKRKKQREKNKGDKRWYEVWKSN
ncbi:hypothetical protein [Lewinella sp. 4G2]|uniref:hypothetical protein n=1 Tax=Lewinella sp. 4G2 TaxID=1803372 RepID=UPI0012F8B94C|nr:hypothetical protein [Lewinella sp. 4G2]